MSLGGHARQTPDKGIHVAISWVFPDASARAAFTPAFGIPTLEEELAEDDIGKFAWDTDTDTVYLLRSINPTVWTPVGGASPNTLLHAGAGLSGGGNLTSDRTFNVVAHPDGSIVANPDNIQVGILATDAQHGARGGGTTHALATTSVPGFMSDVDKVKLNSVASGASALTSAAPVAVTKSAAVLGVGIEAARHDHKHDVSTAAPAAIGVATAPSEGTATTLARSDHTHQANTAPANVTKAAAAIGSSGEPARADHKHDVSTAAPSAMGVATASAEGSATTLARSDHTHQSNTAPVAVTKATAAIGTSGQPARADHKHDVSTAAPGVNGLSTASVEGTATTLARSDHTHQSNTAPANVTRAAAAIGTSGEPARADHKHDIATASAVTLTDATDAEGSATSLARSDHTHSHGARGGGTLHALATTSTAGFMAAADKALLGRVGVISSYSPGAASTSGPTPITKASIILPAENETFIVEASVLMSMSNSTANGAVRLQNITSSTTLSTRDLDAGLSEISNASSPVIRVEYVQTVAAGPQTVAVQYYIASGSGTITVSDALVTARRKL